MLPRERPDRIHVAFDDHRLVADAGLILPDSLPRRFTVVARVSAASSDRHQVTQSAGRICLAQVSMR